MGSLIRLFFNLPWFTYFILAALVVGGSVWLDQDAAKSAKIQQAEYDAGAPDVTPVEDFDQSMISPAGEVFVRTQVHPGAIYDLETSGSRRATVRKTIIFAYPTTAEDDSVPVPMVYFFDQSISVDRFVEAFQVAGGNGLSGYFEVNGQKASPSSAMRDLIRDAARDESLTLSPLLMIVEPFFNGRDVDFKPGKPSSTLPILGALAGILALIGLFKFLRRPKAARDDVI